MKKLGVFVTLVLALGLLGFQWLGSEALGMKNNPVWKIKPRFLSADTVWVDSVMRTLSAEQRIAQLFMVAAYSNRDSIHEREIEALVEEFGIGGLIFFQGGPMRQANLTNRYQKTARVPLMIGIDAEWGLAMRLDSTMKFPKQMTLGAIQNDTLIYMMGFEIGRQCRRLGIHINFAPVVDVNSNPDNPVINFRSFGEDKFNVARKGLAYMLGLQDQNVLANAKHFPGHGDTEADSHLSLPVVNHNKRRLDSLEIYPFRYLINAGLSSVMVAHLYVPALERSENMATTLSKKVVTDLLKKDLGFEGLVFTDALNMKGVSSFNKPGEVDLKALLAGNDVLLFAENVPLAIQLVMEAVKKGEIKQAEIDRRCRKILLAKKWVGLDKQRLVETKNLYEDLHTPVAQYLNRRLTENAITLLENKKDILPIKNLDTLKIACITIGEKEETVFEQTLEKYTEITSFYLPSEPRGSDIGAILPKLKQFNLFVFGLHATTNAPSRNYGITSQAVAFINEINLKQKVIVAHFGNAYGLRKFPGASLMDGLLMCYEDSPESQDIAAQMIFGGIGVKGTLPVNASDYFKINDGMCYEGGLRFKYTLPEELGIKSEKLAMVDSLAILGITEKAYPGCQIFVAKKGKVIYYKSFGYHRYDSVRAVKNSDIYDLASVTKITASVSSLMKLTDEKQFSLDSSLGAYLPDILDSSEYSSIVIRRMLAHEAGLVPWIPFYANTLRRGELMKEIYRSTPSDSFPYRVAENIYILKTYKDSIFKEIKNTKLRSQRNYLYSDVGYYLLQEVIERKTHTTLDKFTDSVFFHPLGATTLTYNPRKKFPLERITPQEDDKIFRKQIIQGDVHDQGAAMLGGVAGHAGLFSNANDLAKMMQMFMQYGVYGGKRYLSSEVIKEFTRAQFPGNRRGAGFDRPTMSDGLGPTCNCVSSASFGHTGFTGITAWADPGEDVIYIFMSNRSYPVGDNAKILKMGLRTQIQQVIYDAFRK